MDNQFYQNVLKQLTPENYTPDQIEYYKNEVELAKGGDQDANHLLRNNFQFNPSFKKQTGLFKNV